MLISLILLLDTSQAIQKELMSNIYDLSCALNGPLPFYHPDHMIHYLMWGKIDLINAVLLSMYRFLKHLVEEDNLTIPYIPPLSISLILRLQNEDQVTKIFPQNFAPADSYFFHIYH